MLPAGGDVMTGREILDHLDIRDQRRACEIALEQIMAEHGIVGHPARQRCAEGIDIIDALAGERALGEQVLIHIRDRRGIGINPAVAGVDLLIQRTLVADRQGRGHARLQNAIALRHPPLRGVEMRPVQRMRDFAHQPPDGIAQKARIGIQRDHEAHILRHGAGGHEAGVLRAAQQAVQLAQFAALALPPHPDAHRGVPLAAAIQKQEAVAVR